MCNFDQDLLLYIDVLPHIITKLVLEVLLLLLIHCYNNNVVQLFAVISLLFIACVQSFVILLLSLLHY